MPPPERALDRSLIRGIAWIGGVKWLTQVISWCVTLIVARILTPADYGLFGMAMVYLGLAQLASEAGLLPVVIQPPVLDEELAARIGGLALMTGIAVFALSVGCSSLVAWFFKEPRVRWLVVALSSSFLLRGLQVLPRGLLARDLDFRRLSWIDGAESMVAASATVTCAVLGLSYWSLVIGALCGISVSTALCFTIRPHRITFPRALGPIAGSLTLGGHVVVSQFAWYAYSNADFAVVGRLLGRAALGAYTFAWTIANVPVDRVTSLVQRVTAPIFAAVQHDRALLRRYLFSLTEGLALVTLPACVGIAAVADVLVRVLLAPAWRDAIAPLRLLALYAAFRCVTSLLAHVLIFTGHARRNMQLSVLAAFVLPVAFYIGSRWGTAGVAGAWVLVYPTVIGACYIHDTLKVAEMPFAEYARALVPAAIGTGAMLAVVAGLKAWLAAMVSPAILLMLLVAGGAATYLAVALTTRGRELRAVLALLRGRAPVAPSYAAEPAGESRGARILLVSWHFPPDAAVGGLRWQKLARYAAERGWGVDVIMRDPRSLDDADPARLLDLPAGTRLYYVGSRPLRLERAAESTLRALRRLRARRSSPAAGGPTAPSRESLSPAQIAWARTPRDLVRAYHALMEHRRGAQWARDAARVGGALVQAGVHRTVVSSGPPHWAHAAARAIAGGAGLPLVVDLRDPWSLVQRLPECIASPVTLRLAARAERRTVDRAALIVANTEPSRDALRRRYPRAADRVIAVPNGFDDDPIPASCPAGGFTIAYAGTIYLDRDPRPLFRAAARVAEAHELTPDEFRMEFMGDVASFDGVPLGEIAKQEDVGRFVRTWPSRPRHEALAFLATATMLVLLPQDSDHAIPAKLFEYLRFDAWMLVLAAPGSATARLLRGTDADVVAPDDDAAIRRAIEDRMAQHTRGERPRALSRHAHLGRQAQAGRFFNAVEAITGAPSHAAGSAPDATPYDQTSEPTSAAGSRVPAPATSCVAPEHIAS